MKKCQDELTQKAVEQEAWKRGDEGDRKSRGRTEVEEIQMEEGKGKGIGFLEEGVIA